MTFRARPIVRDEPTLRSALDGIRALSEHLIRCKSITTAEWVRLQDPLSDVERFVYARATPEDYRDAKPHPTIEREPTSLG